LFPAALTILAGSAWANAPAAATKNVADQPIVIRSSEHLYNLPGLGNVGRVAPGVYRGEQPGAAGYATLKRLGIKTVIDLRTSESEKTQVEAAGMKAIAVPIEMTRKGLRQKVDQWLPCWPNLPTNRSMSTADTGRSHRYCGGCLPDDAGQLESERC